MNKKVKCIFTASIILNAIAFLFVCVLTLHYQAQIKSKFNGLFANAEKEKIEKLAKSMNQEVFDPLYGKYEGGDSVIKVAFVGNSITLHGIAENIGWDHKSGMAASTIDNDYVHKLAKKISLNKKVSVEFAVINVAAFEQNFESFDKKRLEKIKDFSADYVVFQLGENVSVENVQNKHDLFVERYIDFINEFKSSAKIVCLPFWHNKDKIGAITEVALKTNSFIVDLSHLGAVGLDSRNYARSERDYQHAGVGIHPGDFGMENISDNIYSVFNVLIK